MGLYIETNSYRQKVKAIIEMWPTGVQLWDARKAWTEVPEGFVPVCVVHNASFEAAAVAFSPDEYNRFRDRSNGDWRDREWLIVRKHDVLKDVPYSAGFFDEQ